MQLKQWSSGFEPASLSLFWEQLFVVHMLSMIMGKNNKDRYGWRHRQDGSYEPGESMPGTTGDSEGTFHDRVGADNNVIIDGKAQSYESHKKNQSGKTKANKSWSQSQRTEKNSQEQSQDHEDVELGGQFAELDGEVVEVQVERVSSSGNPIATYRGTHVHVPQGEPGCSYQVELIAESGYFTGKVKLRE